MVSVDGLAVEFGGEGTKKVEVCIYEFLATKKIEHLQELEK